MSSRLHPGEFSRNIAKWKRAMIAEITQLSRGIRGSDGQYYLPSLVLSERPTRTVNVTACEAPELFLAKYDDSWVCWKDQHGKLVASAKLNYQPTRRSANASGTNGDDEDSTETPLNRNNMTPQHPISQTGSFDIINPKHIPDAIWKQLQDEADRGSGRPRL